MAEEVEVTVAVVEADRAEVAAEDLRMEAEVTLEAAGDRTDTKIIEQQLEPAPNWGGLFFRENVFGYDFATLSRRRCLPKYVRSGLSRLDIGKMLDGARFMLRLILLVSAPRQDRPPESKTQPCKETRHR
jgi:hypothetical protein